jgi:hypothetical protein
MAPPGTKAIIYEDSDMRVLWAPQCLDAWLLKLSKNHYRCHLYYVPKTSSYRVSGSVNLFPHHCIAPPYSHKTHLQELATELKESLKMSHDENEL